MSLCIIVKVQSWPYKNVLLSRCVAAALEMCQCDTKFILWAFLFVPTRGVTKWVGERETGGKHLWSESESLQSRCHTYAVTSSFWHKTDHFLFATAVLPENGSQCGNSKYKSFPERGIAWTTIVLNHLARASSRRAMSWGEIFLGYHSSNIWRVGLGHI